MLTGKQIDAIQLLLEVPEMTNIAVAETLGLHRNTIYRWRKLDKEFIAAYEEAVKNKWAEARDIALDRMIGMARDGDFRACKYILDGSEFAPVEKKQITTNVENIIRVEIDDNDN